MSRYRTQAQFVSKKLVVEDQYPRQLYSLEGISYPYCDQDDTTRIGYVFCELDDAGQILATLEKIVAASIDSSDGD